MDSKSNRNHDQQTLGGSGRWKTARVETAFCEALGLSGRIAPSLFSQKAVARPHRRAAGRSMTTARGEGVSEPRKTLDAVTEQVGTKSRWGGGVLNALSNCPALPADQRQLISLVIK